MVFTRLGSYLMEKELQGRGRRIIATGCVMGKDKATDISKKISKKTEGLKSGECAWSQLCLPPLDDCQLLCFLGFL